MTQSLDQIKDELDQLSLEIEETISVSLDTSNKLRKFVNKIHDLKKELENSKLEVKPVEQIIEEEIIEPENIIQNEILESQEEKTNSTSETIPEEIGQEITPPKSDPHKEVQIGQRLFLIVGVVLLVLGIGYFLKYSFDQNWIGPAARVALAYTGAMSLLGIGEIFRRKEFERFGLYLIGGGISSLYFSSYAGYGIYDLFSQELAFALMCLVTIFAGTLSIIYGLQWLSILGIIGGFITPIVLSDGSGNYKVLLSYMAVLNFGILAISTFRNWNLLIYLGLILNWSIFSAWHTFDYSSSKFWFTFICTQIYFVQYSLIAFGYSLKNAEVISARRYYLTTLNILFALSNSYALISSKFSLPWLSLVTLFYILVYLSIAQKLVQKCKENLNSLFIIISQIIILLALTIPIITSDHWVSCGWALLSAGMIWFALKINYKKLLYMGIGLFLLSYGYLWINYVESFGWSPIYADFENFYDTFFERMIALISVLGSGFFIYKKSNSQHPVLKVFIGGLVLFYVFLFSNIELASYFNEFYRNATFAALSVWWSIFSIALMVVGFIKKSKIFRRLSIFLFSITILKVFFFDMSQISTPYRIISFIILGILLIGASYLYYKYKDRLLGSEHETTST